MIEVHVEKISFYPPSKGYAVLLKEAEGSRYLPVIVGSFEAQSIALALEEVQMPRPMTHDLFCSVLEEHTIEVNEVIISELAEGTFFSKIMMMSELGDRTIDARPSDAIALALRLSAPIYVAEAVMDEAGVNDISESTEEISTSSIEKVEEQKLSDSSDVHLKRLQDRLDKAVVEEEYEEAAQIRDEIKKILAEPSDR